jgi:hypothetical protein
MQLTPAPSSSGPAASNQIYMGIASEEVYETYSIILDILPKPGGLGGGWFKEKVVAPDSGPPLRAHHRSVTAPVYPSDMPPILARQEPRCEYIYGLIIVVGPLLVPYSVGT